MSQHNAETIVGGVVLVAAVGFIAYASQFAGLSMSDGGYDLNASFRSVEGVSVGTDVRMVGVKIGSVSDLALDTELFRAQAVLSIEDGIGVPNDSTAIISSEGLLGGNFVEILPGASMDNFQPGEEIIDTQGAVSLMSLLLKFVSGGSGGTE